MMEKLAELLGGILCKPHKKARCIAGRIGMAIGHFLVDMVYIAIIMVTLSATFIAWFAVPVLVALLLSGQEWNAPVEESFMYYWIASIFVWVFVTGLAKIKFSK